MSKEPDKSWKRMVRTLSHQQQVDQRKPAGTEHALKSFIKAEVNRAQRSLIMNVVRPLPEEGNKVWDHSNENKELETRSPITLVLPQDVTQDLWLR